MASEHDRAAPSHFIPELPGWETRSLFIAREGLVSFYHYDFTPRPSPKSNAGTHKIATTWP
jgi:hypothetical protein